MEHRWEVAFGEDVGYLPVRVRLLTGKDRKPFEEYVNSEFKHFRIDGVSYFFPTQFTTRSLENDGKLMNEVMINKKSIHINQPIPRTLFQLESDPVGFHDCGAASTLFPRLR